MQGSSSNRRRRVPLRPSELALLQKPWLALSYAKTVEWRETKRGLLPCCFGVIPNGSVVLLYPTRDKKNRLTFPTFAHAIEQDIAHVAPRNGADDSDWRAWWQYVPMTKVCLYHNDRPPEEMWIPNGVALAYDSERSCVLGSPRLTSRLKEHEYANLISLKIWQFARIAKPQHRDVEAAIPIETDNAAKVGKGRQLAWGF